MPFFSVRDRNSRCSNLERTGWKSAVSWRDVRPCCVSLFDAVDRRKEVRSSTGSSVHSDSSSPPNPEATTSAWCAVVLRKCGMAAAAVTRTIDFAAPTAAAAATCTLKLPIILLTLAID
eukprot:CAMPEP_0178985972 /NCGR_PEP_ID=MMETSP0795-20121207/2446_1 /TAXON_ID=88552 /ORGANISM="Amoebophrya sp., Strain Ameob2" /LENGTH=118 /DNA_ID=CAMNT_0020676983 /DNA_START=1695 /DNA_END=2051 /DNA_ORIENTATION=-